MNKSHQNTIYSGQNYEYDSEEENQEDFDDNEEEYDDEYDFSIRNKVFVKNKSVKEPVKEEKKKAPLPTLPATKIEVPTLEKSEPEVICLRSAEIIWKQIIWDPSLDKYDFTVGYVDTFGEVKEQMFVLTEYMTREIMKDRIKYFKKKDEIVWDREKKIDKLNESKTWTAELAEKPVEEDRPEIETLSSN